MRDVIVSSALAALGQSVSNAAVNMTVAAGSSNCSAVQLTVSVPLFSAADATEAAALAGGISSDAPNASLACRSCVSMQGAAAGGFMSLVQLQGMVANASSLVQSAVTQASTDMAARVGSLVGSAVNVQSVAVASSGLVSQANPSGSSTGGGQSAGNSKVNLTVVAAVVVPLLVAAGVAAGFFIYRRHRAQRKRALSLRPKHRPSLDRSLRIRSAAFSDNSDEFVDFSVSDNPVHIATKGQQEPSLAPDKQPGPRHQRITVSSFLPRIPVIRQNNPAVGLSSRSSASVAANAAAARAPFTKRRVFAPVVYDFD